MRALAIVLAVVALVIAAALVALSFAPASLASRAVARASGGALALADAEGSLADGRARIVDAAHRVSVPIAWRLDRTALANGTLRVDLGRGAGDPVRGTLRVTRTTLALDDADITVPAALVGAWLPPPLHLTLGGDLHMTTSALRVGPHGDGTAEVRWTPARAADASAQAIDFGTATATIASSGPAVSATLASTGGDTAVGGTLAANERGASIDVTLTPRDATPSPLLRAIASLGAPAPGGGTRFATRYVIGDVAPFLRR
jgi:hypothetical protein